VLEGDKSFKQKIELAAAAHRKDIDRAITEAGIVLPG
jgi:hypothetical protein